MSVLDKAWIKFHTNDEDKDGDTFVTVQYWSKENVLVAMIESYFSRFSEGDDFGPYELSIINDIGNKNDIFEGKVIIRIAPNGNDTWRFNFSPILRFSDGSKYMCTINGIQLSEDHRELSYTFTDSTFWLSGRDLEMLSMP